MKRKIYVSPTAEVVRLHAAGHLLSASLKAGDYGDGGDPFGDSSGGVGSGDYDDGGDPFGESSSGVSINNWN